jgi:hypothetical protein
MTILLRPTLLMQGKISIFLPRKFLGRFMSNVHFISSWSWCSNRKISVQQLNGSSLNGVRPNSKSEIQEGGLQTRSTPLAAWRLGAGMAKKRHGRIHKDGVNWAFLRSVGAVHVHDFNLRNQNYYRQLRHGLNDAIKRSNACGRRC